MLGFYKCYICIQLEIFQRRLVISWTNSNWLKKSPNIISLKDIHVLLSLMDLDTNYIVFALYTDCFYDWIGCFVYSELDLDSLNSDFWTVFFGHFSNSFLTFLDIWIKSFTYMYCIDTSCLLKLYVTSMFVVFVFCYCLTDIIDT